MNKELETIKHLIYTSNTQEHGEVLYEIDIDKCFDNIEKELTKAQEYKSMLNIIEKKCVGNDNLYLVKNSIYYKQYLGMAKLSIDNIVNINLKENDLLTQEEFDTLKEWLANE